MLTGDVTETVSGKRGTTVSLPVLVLSVIPVRNAGKLEFGKGLLVKALLSRWQYNVCMMTDESYADRVSTNQHTSADVAPELYERDTQEVDR